MFRSFLSACSVVVLVLPTLLFPPRVPACPVKAPETLLSLYRNSDAIYVARYAKSEDLDIIEDSGEETILNVRKFFDVTTALKGEPRKFVTIDERDYRYKVEQTDDSPDEETVDNEADEEVGLYIRPTIEPGDTVLLFLKQYRQEDGKMALGLTDYRDAIKKFSAERLDAYQAKIRELNSIFGGKKIADNSAIVDWLVRTTQDPLTRWEGAYELKQSYEMMQWEESRKAEEMEAADEEESEGSESSVASANSEVAASAETADKGEVTTETVSEQEVQEEDFDNTVYARLLTDSHKQTLLNILVEAVSEETGDTARKNKSMSEADRVLIDLVANWGDDRLAKFLLDKMQREGEAPYVVYRLMTTAVTVLGDSQLEEIVEKYSGVYYEDDDEFIDSDDDDEKVVDREETDSGEDTALITTSAIEPEKATETVEAAESGGTAQKPQRITYRELRSELLSRFVTEASAILAKSEMKEAAQAEK